MIHSAFTTFLVEPIYNVFVALIAFIPGHDAGIAIIILTLIIRGIFFPTFAQAMRTQHAMKRVEGDIAEINKKHKDNPTERGRKTMELFREHQIRPFASILALLIQLPVFIALYAVFLREGFPDIALELLYSFTPLPQMVQPVFLGFLDLTHAHLIPLAIFTAAVQYVQSRISAGAMPTNLPQEKAQLMLMQRQMLLYFLPFMMGFITYTLPAAAGLYLITNALVSVGQELLIARKYKEAK
jgi:YidC/Oxa1 family membrane protein insertase